MSILKINNINKTFISKHKTVQTLKNINLEIEAGEFICIVGSSGCGKTTLLNIVAGLEKATSGNIFLNGREISSPGIDRTVLFQEHALFPWLRVIDNVEFGMKMLRISKKDRREKALKYLDMVKLRGFENSFIHELSGGMRQRVALARALAVDSDILLMDEPFSALDNQTKNILLEELHNICLTTKKTIIFVTHNVDEAVYLADKVVVMESSPGRVKNVIYININEPRKRSSLEYIAIVDEIISEMSKETENKAGEKDYEHEKDN
ncbi:ABC transporter ATP-binding protein [Clostridium beijerinckii]|uniref:Aliphatic sulfonates import ATP-binding protein SsuB n=1 Tax=Clostridium beijerinckii TaxID=1520 RepID=A0A1S8S651_CLOBE|nr:ABC transporter ATP-binding protein [Clostridium beijerinckii]NRY60057.1 NitT/TauT family transport system ATP-binding protein [Clostridium beijerinckii]OOM60913.1 aliphatic sulfonates import ATP-binding protein SsuB [Clostridium beijerinckii]